MNGKRITILIVALMLWALIIWYETPIKFPGMMLQFLRIFVELAVVLAVAVFAFMFTGKKKKPS